MRRLSYLAKTYEVEDGTKKCVMCVCAVVPFGRLLLPELEWDDYSYDLCFVFCAAGVDEIVSVALVEVHDQCGKTSFGNHIALQQAGERAVAESFRKAGSKSFSRSSCQCAQLCRRKTYLGLSLIRR